MNRRFLTYDVYAYDMILQFVSNVVWRHLFNKTADNLERSMENEDECTILPCTLLIILLMFSVVCMLLESGYQVLSACILSTTAPCTM